MQMNYQVLIVFLIMGLSLRRRMFNKKRSLGADLPVESVASPFSKALMELLSTAGGIYLSLLLLVQFLSVDIPALVNIFGLEIDPIALAAVLIASLQPFLANFNFPKKR
jgi:hypothetical protein